MSTKIIHIIDPLDRGKFDPNLPDMPLDTEWLRKNNLLPEQWKRKNPNVKEAAK